MSGVTGPNMVTDGLVMKLDAGNVQSYPGSGTYWYDLTKTINEIPVLVNGPAYNSNGYFDFDGSNDYVQLNSGNDHAFTPDGSVGSNVICYEIWLRNTSGDVSGYHLSRPWNGSGQYNYYLYNTGWYLTAGSTSAGIVISGGIGDGEWHQVIVWCDTTHIGYYKDGVGTSSSHSMSGAVPSSGNNNLPVAVMTLYPYGTGSWNYTGHAIDGDVAIVKRYNRVLTAAEALQNYNAHKSRFGL